jgi:hypothetical protein
MVALSQPPSMLIIIGNIDGLEANNQSWKFQRSITSMQIEHSKSHNFCINVTNQVAEAG